MIEQKQLEASIAKAAADVRANNPLAGSITNTVTIDFVANAQLAVGGSAAMVYLPDEGETLVAAGGAQADDEGQDKEKGENSLCHFLESSFLVFCHLLFTIC